MDKKKFKNKVVVITGGASGIGLATALEFAKSGAKIALLDMDSKALETSRVEFVELGYECIIVVCDVTHEDFCQAAIGQVISHYGHIDILFNNAGITQRGLFEDTKSSVFKKVMDVNFYGSLFCTKSALQSLMEQKGLIIVNESIAGVAPLVGRTGYSASKHALHGLFTSLRCELRHKGVHVMIVAPGFIKTDLQKRALGSDGNIATHEQTIIGKQSSVKDVARKIIKHSAKRSDMVVLTGVGKLGVFISRLAPWIYERIMTYQFREELKNNSGKDNCQDKQNTG
jgi:NAD(P)-dependent dehydrogenase (short-subunit alcohol dehydrogenase family)